MPPVVGLCEDESVNDAPFYVMGFVEGPILRSARGGRAASTRTSAARSASASSTRWSRSTRSIPTRSGSATWAARRTTSRASCTAGTASGRSRRPASCRLVDEVHERLVGAHPRAGPGDDRPRRLPARQHDPLARRARSPRWSTGSSARSATRSPTSACCSSTGPRRATSCMPLFAPADDRRRASRRATTSRQRYAERSGPRPRRDRLLRRPRLLEAGDHPRGRLRPLRRRPVRQEADEGFAGVRDDRRAARRGRRRGRAPAARADQRLRPEPGRRAAAGSGPARRPEPSSRFAQRLSSRRAITILWTSSGPSATRSMRHEAPHRRRAGCRRTCRASRGPGSRGRARP